MSLFPDAFEKGRTCGQCGHFKKTACTAPIPHSAVVVTMVSVHEGSILADKCPAFLGKVMLESYIPPVSTQPAARSAV